MDLPFEETYLVNLVERPDKYETMRKRISYMGWDVKDFRVVKHPISNVFARVRGDHHNMSGNELNCAREQYTIIKSAYLRGVETVAIMEDDISFYKDMSVWDEHFNNLPNDWDILRINSLRGANEEYYYWDDLWNKQENILFGSGFYAMNRKSMKYIIDCMDETYQPIDNILAYHTDKGINLYLPNTPLSLCLEDSFNSDIRGMITNENYHPWHYNYLNISTFNREDYI